ncbi:hypothetical protein ACTL6U_11940 [Rhodovibrionaceae bacterium A322]
MTLEQFDLFLNRYGPDLDRWPEDIEADEFGEGDAKKSAHALLAREPAAGALLAEMQALNSLITKATAATQSDQDQADRLYRELQQRRNNQEQTSAFSLHRWLALITVGGGLASASGVLLAFLLPLTFDSSALLSLALGDILP